MSEQFGLPEERPDATTEHQTPRDIRQWAIIEAGRYEREPEKVLETAKRYVDFVEGLSAIQRHSGSIFRLFCVEEDGRHLYLVDAAYTSKHGNLSSSKEVAWVSRTKDGAELLLSAVRMVDGRELSIGEYSE